MQSILFVVSYGFEDGLELVLLEHQLMLGLGLFDLELQGAATTGTHKRLCFGNQSCPLGSRAGVEVVQK